MKLKLEPSIQFASQLALPIVVISHSIPQESAFKTPIVIIALILALVNLGRFLVSGKK